MAKLRVHSFAISLDGYGAGPDQDLANPLGVGGVAMHQWVFATRTFQRVHGREGGATGTDDDFAARGFAHIGAWILGRNMFGPVRGPWPDDTWKGWKGKGVRRERVSRERRERVSGTLSGGTEESPFISVLSASVSQW